MIREASINDLESIVEIFNQSIAAKFQTAFTEQITKEERTGWFYAHQAGKYPLFVYEENGKVIGYLNISSYREGRAALRYTVEVSYFVHKEYQGRSVGQQLLEHGINACKLLHYKTMLAIVLEPNLGSIRLLEKFGFERWAMLPLIADFEGVECSHVYYGLKL